MNADKLAQTKLQALLVSLLMVLNGQPHAAAVLTPKGRMSIE
jgi:hypothetical protein